ncbi:MAG: 30S ribosomal protein S5 [Candidatus Diapherotrites archaeon]|nr:30S ribosomal protein S5 [Candidatus Diapherotrites archaeon]
MENRERRRFEPEPKIWTPKTALGRQVKDGQITSLDAILTSGQSIAEAEIVDALLPNIRSETLSINRTTRIRDSGRVMSFQATVAVGNGNGYVGIGTGKALSVRDAIEKAVRKAKMSIMSIKRGCGSWQCTCGNPHTVPFKVEGKCGSVRIILMPAPNGLGISTGKTAKTILELAGINDAWLTTKGKTSTSMNFAKATVDALKQTNLKKGKMAEFGEAPKIEMVVETKEESE